MSYTKHWQGRNWQKARVDSPRDMGLTIWLANELKRDFQKLRSMI